MGAPYTTKEATTIRDFVRRRTRERDIARARLLERARADGKAIVRRIVARLDPSRVYLWGSSSRGDCFTELSDIDIVVEGVKEPCQLYEMQAALQQSTAFDLDLVNIENLPPALAEHIRKRGKVMHERATPR